MSKAGVCVFGSANMDLVVYADRAPGMGETVAGKRFVTIAGGKGANQAIAAARAGGRVAMVGAVGHDPYGDDLLAVLSDAGVDVSGVARVSEATGTAHIVVDTSGDNSIIVVPGANGSLASVPPALSAALDGAGALLMQLEIPLEAVTEAAELARAKGVRVVLTPAPARELPGELLDCVDLLLPNEHEAKLLTGASSVEEAASALLERVTDVVVTLGGRGSLWAARSGERVEVPSAKVEVRDTTAAGDTFAGALAVALGEGRPMPDALRWATAAAGVSVQREGASPSMPSRPEIDAALSVVNAG
ncbi:ribokinase [Flindersiella endophytica]